MYNLQEALESTIQETLENDISDKDISCLEARISNIVLSLVDETAEDILDQIKHNAFSGSLEDARADRLQFEQRLMEHWRRPIDLLELFITLAREAGSDFNSEFRNQTASSDDAVFEALIRLHGKACQVSNEILVLLSSGYADGAHARWRTLHEIAVISYFLSEHGQELAEKYLLHDAIQRYKLACQYQKHSGRLNQEQIPREEFDNLKVEHDRLVSEFGNPFKSDYGWAASITHPKSPTIVTIEECVDLEHWRPYFKMASDNIHANSHGTYFKLGLASHQSNVILAGSSNMGLVDPGHSTAISLHQITAVLLANRSSFDFVVVSNVLQRLVDEVGEAFLEVHREVELLANNED